MEILAAYMDDEGEPAGPPAIALLPARESMDKVWKHSRVKMISLRRRSVRRNSQFASGLGLASSQRLGASLAPPSTMVRGGGRKRSPSRPLLLGRPTPTI